jgi:prepilin peptidase CpaA
MMSFLTVLSWVLGASAIALLAYAALHDLVARTVPNGLSVGILMLGIAIRMIDHSLVFGLEIGAAIFVLLFAIWLLGAVGGGDVKLWAASALLIPPHWQLELSFFMQVILIGGALAVVYLALRFVVPRPRASRAGSLAARALRVEAWRIRRKGPLPYAFAIAGGAILTMLPLSLSVLR